MDLSAQLSNLPTEVIELAKAPKATPPARPPVRKLQRQVRLNDEQVRDLIAQHQAGLSVRALSNGFGINRETVLKHLKRAGVPRRPIGASCPMPRWPKQHGYTTLPCRS